jgi:hypothetical protein
MGDPVHDDHGNTLAAWVCVGLLILASFVMSLAVVLASIPLFAAGAAVAAAGLVAGKVLQLAGYGRATTERR